MTELTIDKARRMIDHAFAGGRVHPSILLAGAVVDHAGYALVTTREPGAPPLLIDIALAKAKSCVLIDMPTKAIMELAARKPTWFESASRVMQSSHGAPLWGAKGGVSIRNKDGALMGALAIAGDTGDGDEAHAAAAIDSVGFVADVDGLDVVW